MGVDSGRASCNETYITAHRLRGLMREDTRRLVAAGVLVFALVAMTVHYGAVDADHDRLAMDGQRLANYEANVGETVFFWGEVVGRDGGALVVDARSMNLAVRTEREVAPGSALQVYGRLEPGHVVVPERLVVSRASNLRYLYLVSAVGGLVAAVAFLRTWRVDLDRRAFVPPEESEGPAGVDDA